MQPPIAAARSSDDLIEPRREQLVNSGLRELPVVDGDGTIVGFVDEADAMRAYLDAAGAAKEGER